MKEIIRDLINGKRRVNIAGVVALIVMFIMIGLVIRDLALLTMGACFTWYGVCTFIGEVAIACTCYDYLFTE